MQPRIDFETVQRSCVLKGPSFTKTLWYKITVFAMALKILTENELICLQNVCLKQNYMIL